jgi:hypothetical protein
VTLRTTVGELRAEHIGLTVEVQCPGRPIGSYRGSSASNADAGGMTLMLRSAGTPTRMISCRDATPVIVHTVPADDEGATLSH